MGPSPPWLSSSKLGPSLVVWINSLDLQCLRPGSPSPDPDQHQLHQARTVTTLANLNDAVVLGNVLVEVDPNYFRSLASGSSTSTSTSKALSENWVLRFNALKRLYKLIIRYFDYELRNESRDVLKSSTSALPTPNLQVIAKGGSGADEETCRLAGLVLALAVQSDKRQQHVARIQSLDEWVQREIMISIEQVMTKIDQKDQKDSVSEVDADSEFYDLQHERSRLMHDKETLQVVHEELMRNYEQLKEDHEEALKTLSVSEEKAAAAASGEKGRNDRADIAFKAEFDRLRGDLAKAENNLGDAEQVVERQTRLIEDLTKKVDELAPRAEEATRLKDQMDEYRHAADKARKTENVIEKYKKKLEESADLRRSIKTLEEQNSDLLDKNASLEDDYKKVSAFKPLMDSYKSQLDALDAKSSALTRENEGLKHDLETARERLRVSEEERRKEGETLGLFEERVKELELGEGKKKKARTRADSGDSGAGGGLEDEDDDDGEGIDGFGGELDDAISGTTMTDLKLQVRRLKRELDAATINKADSSRIVVLENLLEDANRMKSRYETDWLKEHREKLVLGTQLEEILKGASSRGNGPEVALALRKRLNETVEELDKLRKRYSELEVRSDTQAKELTVVKADLNLVNKDQVDIVKSLRASVSVERDSLAEEVEKLRKSLVASEDKSKMQMSQINKILMEKVSLQSDGIAKFRQLQQDYEKSQATGRDLKSKLSDARKFITDQDLLIQKAREAESNGNLEETEQSYRSQISTLTDELTRLKTNNIDIEARYRREHQLMLSAWHAVTMQQMRETIVQSASASKSSQQPTSWLGQQRAKANGPGLVFLTFRRFLLGS
ncbi:HOOK-domain-containing protein [Meredithblackwellia eburnea MCA 4105]